MFLNALREVAKRVLPQGSRLSLFGSKARGDARFDSDWDIHILIPGDKRLSLQQADDICWEFNQVGIYDFDEQIGSFAYSNKDWERRNFLPFYHNVERDKVILFQN